MTMSKTFPLFCDTEMQQIDEGCRAGTLDSEASGSTNGILFGKIFGVGIFHVKVAVDDSIGF